ncbi:MAG: hypothetical protein V2I67_12545 [Thermoanaerobaculales bacterium]|jgi:hypothetical protein|nr:hypothetical protein [Thermoanaerobaculales bacterium]
MSGSFEYRVDKSKNRLYLKLGGFFRKGDVPETMEKLAAALAEVEPGFDVVTDLTDFVPGSPGSTAALTKGGELVSGRGRRRGVRITGGLMTGLMQFQRLLSGVFKDEDTRYAKSVAEADAILDNWEGGE